MRLECPCPRLYSCAMSLSSSWKSISEVKEELILQHNSRICLASLSCTDFPRSGIFRVRNNMRVWHEVLSGSLGLVMRRRRVQVNDPRFEVLAVSDWCVRAGGSSLNGHWLPLYRYPKPSLDRFACRCSDERSGASAVCNLRGAPQAVSSVRKSAIRLTTITHFPLNLPLRAYCRE